MGCFIFREKKLFLPINISILDSVHQFKIREINGGEIDFRSYNGRKILLVNVASECGYTPQYQQLQELYEEFSDKLVVVGVPSNDFGGQEPGSDEDIKGFCERRYGITFPLAAKTPVTGSGANPVFQWLAQQKSPDQEGCRPKWNFHKFLFDEAGRLEHCLPSSVSPLDDPVLDWVQR